MLTSIIGSLIIGLMVGAFGREIMHGEYPMGCIATALLGIGGSLIGGLLGSAVWPAVGQEGLTSSRRLLHFTLAVVGAVIMLWLWRAITGPR